MNYLVIKPFDGHAVGDTVKLHPRQSKYLLLSGHIQPIQPKPSEKTKNKEAK